MHIRPIQPSDYDSILALNLASVTVLSPLNGTQLIKLLEQAILKTVIEIEGVVAAFLVVLGPKSEYSSINYQWFDTHYSDFYYIDRVVVHADYRGQKLGQTLYQHLINDAKQNHIHQLCAEIDIAPPNEPSLHFHRSWGFQEVSTLMHHPEKIVSLQVSLID